MYTTGIGRAVETYSNVVNDVSRRTVGARDLWLLYTKYTTTLIRIIVNAHVANVHWSKRTEFLTGKDEPYRFSVDDGFFPAPTNRGHNHRSEWNETAVQNPNAPSEILRDTDKSKCST